ncbi:MAG: 4-hydroxy-3-methylbut-2-enyl diphosphate reductase [bacterium]|nr:4-hydroxy-3-methylbut-2-enyl diphosphate reductase [bacterium]
MEKKNNIIIRISRHVGYCGGVRRTLNIVDELLRTRSNKKIYMLGEIVHNEFVLNKLKEQGLSIINDFQEARGGLLVIQSHGITEALADRIRSSGIEYLDTTCPMVKNIHRNIKDLEARGYFPVIIGAKDHSEVIGIAGQVKESRVFRKPEAVEPALLRDKERVGIVIQSTFIEEEAMKIVEKIRTCVKEVVLEDTICLPTKERQKDVYENSDRYDCVFIIGSVTSANTKNLYEIARQKNEHSFLISTPEDLERIDLGRCTRFYVVSGASTPLELIEKFVAKIREVKEDH